MRVLITAIAAYGHLQPLIPLAKALSEAGHEVAIATASELRSRVEAAGFAAFDAGMEPSTAFGRLAERFPDQEYHRLAPAEILGWYLPHLFGEVLMPAMLADLEPIVRAWQPNVILHDTWEFAGPLAAAMAGVPSVNQTLGIRFDDRLIESAAAAVAPFWRQHGLEPDRSAGLYRHLCLDITPPGFQPYDTASYREAMRPLRPVAAPPLPGEKLPQWVERVRELPLVSMTLGTNAGTNGDISMFRSVIEGLRGLDVELLITSGPNQDLVKSLGNRVHVERYLPHSLLFPHCSLVICHGGPGTTLSALAQGLPLLILPQGADQYIVGDLVHASGVGLRLVPAEVNPLSIREAVLDLLHTASYRNEARRLQREIATMPTPAEVVPLIEERVSYSH